MSGVPCPRSHSRAVSSNVYATFTLRLPNAGSDILPSVSSTLSPLKNCERHLYLTSGCYQPTKGSIQYIYHYATARLPIRRLYSFARLHIPVTTHALELVMHHGPSRTRQRDLPYASSSRTRTDQIPLSTTLTPRRIGTSLSMHSLLLSPPLRPRCPPTIHSFLRVLLRMQHLFFTLHTDFEATRLPHCAHNDSGTFPLLACTRIKCNDALRKTKS